MEQDNEKKNQKLNEEIEKELITAEKEIETKFDFYTQTVSTQTTYYMGDKKQIQPGAAGYLPLALIRAASCSR